jgi:hypothetical protein
MMLMNPGGIRSGVLIPSDNPRIKSGTVIKVRSFDHVGNALQIDVTIAARTTAVCYQPSGCDEEFRTFEQGMEHAAATAQWRSNISFARLTIRNDFAGREL